MDPLIITELSAQLTSNLSYLYDEFKKRAKDNNAKDTGDVQLFSPDSDDEIQRVWEKIQEKLASKPTVAEALDDLKSTPNDTDIQASVRVQLKKLLSSDEKFAKEVFGVLSNTTSTNLQKLIVPGVDTKQIEELVHSTLKEATSSLRITTKVNIGVLIFGSVIVIASLIFASITNRWEAVAFGGFGMAGVITSLITNPLTSIGASARRLVQIQVAYLSFLNQLTMLNQDSKKLSAVERSQRLGDEMARTLQSLSETFGK